MNRFYASTLSNHPEVQHIMKISLNRNPEPICLTCYLGNSCRFNEAIFNLPSTNYVLECRGYEIPRVQLRDARTNDLLDTLENNNKLFQFLKNKHIPRYEKIFVKLVDNYGIADGSPSLIRIANYIPSNINLHCRCDCGADPAVRL